MPTMDDSTTLETKLENYRELILDLCKQNDAYRRYGRLTLERCQQEGCKKYGVKEQRAQVLLFDQICRCSCDLLRSSYSYF